MKHADKELLRLRIEPVIRRAEEIAERVAAELPGHEGILRAARGVASAASEAKLVSERLRRPWGLHRVPAAFLAATLLLLGLWLYWQFFHVATLTVAVPEFDAIQLRQRLTQYPQVRIRTETTHGSRENIQLLQQGRVDLAIVQGGIPIQPDLARLETRQPMTVLYFTRAAAPPPGQPLRILTAAEGQGSHAVAEIFAGIWQIRDRVSFVHDWEPLLETADGASLAEIDMVFVVKDLADERIYAAIRRLAEAGFQLRSPRVGAHAIRHAYLRPVEIPAGYLNQSPPLPQEAVETYAVSTYLVARRGLTPRRLAAARHLLDAETDWLWATGFEPTVSGAGEVLQAVEAFLGILIYIGLTFLALLGLEVATYRRRFHELNTLVSLISMHQSDKDVLGMADHHRLHENLHYLSTCSDLLGLISVISGYYAQVNSSLIYSGLLETIHHRCSGLKLNIQTKILHAAIPLPPRPALDAAPAEPAIAAGTGSGGAGKE